VFGVAFADLVREQRPEFRELRARALFLPYFLFSIRFFTKKVILYALVPARELAAIVCCCLQTLANVSFGPIGIPLVPASPPFGFPYFGVSLHNL
jgi:hypothetical protein